MPAGYIYLSLFAGMYGTVVPKLSEMKLCMPPFYSALVTNGWTRICCLRGERGLPFAWLFAWRERKNGLPRHPAKHRQRNNHHRNQASPQVSDTDRRLLARLSPMVWSSPGSWAGLGWQGRPLDRGQSSQTTPSVFLVLAFLGSAVSEF